MSQDIYASVHILTREWLEEPKYMQVCPSWHTPNITGAWRMNCACPSWQTTIITGAWRMNCDCPSWHTTIITGGWEEWIVHVHVLTHNNYYRRAMRSCCVHDWWCSHFDQQTYMPSSRKSHGPGKIFARVHCWPANTYRMATGEPQINCKCPSWPATVVTGECQLKEGKCPCWPANKDRQLQDSGRKSHRPGNHRKAERARNCCYIAARGAADNT
jgi:hypothetical protein